MKIEEAIVYLIAGGGHGMTVDQLVREINARKLHVRRDGQPVTAKQVYAVIKHFDSVFCFNEGRVRLLA